MESKLILIASALAFRAIDGAPFVYPTGAVMVYGRVGAFSVRDLGEYPMFFPRKTQWKRFVVGIQTS